MVGGNHNIEVRVLESNGAHTYLVSFLSADISIMVSEVDCMTRFLEASKKVVGQEGPLFLS